MDFKIYNIRNQQVMLDRDLAKAYEVKNKRLNEQVKRNKDRFPDDFCFQLNQKEFDILRSQFATANKHWNKKRFLPLVFTQQGIAMLSAVLRSEKAIEISIKIINQFIQMRKFLNTNAGIL